MLRLEPGWPVTVLAQALVEVASLFAELDSMALCWAYESKTAELQVVLDSNAHESEGLLGFPHLDCPGSL